MLATMAVASLTFTDWRLPRTAGSRFQV